MCILIDPHMYITCEGGHGGDNGGHNTGWNPRGGDWAHGSPGDGGHHSDDGHGKRFWGGT